MKTSLKSSILIPNLAQNRRYQLALEAKICAARFQGKHSGQTPRFQKLAFFQLVFKTETTCKKNQGTTLATFSQTLKPLGQISFTLGFISST